MKPCDMDTGAARIRHGLKELQRVWEESREEWDDSMSRSFAEHHLEPIVPIVKNTMDAVGRMRALLHEAQRDLES